MNECVAWLKCHWYTICLLSVNSVHKTPFSCSLLPFMNEIAMCSRLHRFFKFIFPSRVLSHSLPFSLSLSCCGSVSFAGCAWVNSEVFLPFVENLDDKPPQPHTHTRTHTSTTSNDGKGKSKGNSKQ